MSLASGFKSFMQGASGSAQMKDEQYARDMQQKNVQLAEESAQRTRNLDDVYVVTNLATDLGIVNAAGTKLDPEKLTALWESQAKSGKIDPKLQQLAAALGNDDSAVKNNIGFSFTGVTEGPDNTIALQGNYDGDEKKKYSTVGRIPGDDAEVAFSSYGDASKLMVNQYNQMWNRPGVSGTRREFEMKNSLTKGNDKIADNEELISNAVGQLTNDLEDALIATGSPEAAATVTKLKQSFIGVPWAEQLKVLQQYGSELQVPVAEIVTPEVQEAVAAEEAKQTAAPSQSAPADNSAEIAALEARIAKVQPGRGGAARKAALQKQVDSLKSASPAPAEEAAPVDENPAIQSGVEKTKAATDEDIVEGKVQFTQEEIVALQERLKGKGIETLEDMNKATRVEQQELRAMLSTIAVNKEQRKTYLERMNNVMATGSADYNSKDLQEAQLAQQTEERAGFQAETSRMTANTAQMTAETGRLNYFRQVEGHDWKVSEKIGDRIRGNFAAAKAAIYGTDDDGNVNSDINFDEGRFFSEYRGAFDGAYTEFRNAPSGTPRKAESQVALNSMISMGIQALAESEEYGSFGENFLPDGAIDYIDGNDNLLSRLQVQADGSVIVYDPTTDSQQDESVPASVLRRIFGDSGYAYFIKEIRGAKGSLKAQAKTNKAG